MKVFKMSFTYLDEIIKHADDPSLEMLESVVWFRSRRWNLLQQGLVDNILSFEIAGQDAVYGMCPNFNAAVSVMYKI